MTFLTLADMKKQISELEQKFLAQSSSDDIHAKPPKQNIKIAEKLLSHISVQHDVAVFARVLINVYAGWPFHNEITRLRVLRRLDSIYENASTMNVREFAKKLGGVLNCVPDNHIKVLSYDRSYGYKFDRKYVNVGKNLAAEKQVVTQMLANNVALIAFSGMFYDKSGAEQLLNFKDKLQSSSALIIDLHGNSGGDGRYSDELAFFLCGNRVRSAKEIYVRTNSDAKKFLDTSMPYAKWRNIEMTSDPALYIKSTRIDCNLTTGYNKPIYILTDCFTGSSAEMFCLRMVHHPYVNFVGDNTMGCEVYGNVGFGNLPESTIAYAIGTNYRVLEYDVFETQGLTPNIKCHDGENAFDVALRDFAVQNMSTKDYGIKR